MDLPAQSSASSRTSFTHFCKTSSSSCRCFKRLSSSSFNINLGWFLSSVLRISEEFATIPLPDDEDSHQPISTITKTTSLHIFVIIYLHFRAEYECPEHLHRLFFPLDFGLYGNDISSREKGTFTILSPVTTSSLHLVTLDISSRKSYEY